MEYLLGSIVTLTVLAIISRINAKRIIYQKPLVPNSQSIRFQVTKDFITRSLQPKPVRKTQARTFLSRISTRVLILQNNAYWISNNALYMADIVDNEIDETSTRTVDTMGMDKVQLDKTIFIVARLTEGLEDDRGNTGNKKF